MNKTVAISDFEAHLNATISSPISMIIKSRSFMQRLRECRTELALFQDHHRPSSQGME